MGLRCIAAVVYNDCSEPLAAISVSGMTSRVTDERLPVLGRIVREVAAELTVALGGVMPDAADDAGRSAHNRFAPAPFPLFLPANRPEQASRFSASCHIAGNKFHSVETPALRSR